MLNRIKWLVCLAVLFVTALSLAYSSISLLFSAPSREPWENQDSHSRLRSSASNSLAYCPQLDQLQNQEQLEEAPLKEWDPSRFIKGPPTRHFRDNLLEDKFYITATANAGFTNQFMSTVNMIYLGMITDRIPIIPPFGPDHHISHDAGMVPFGDIFNLSRATDAIHRPLLEWRDVKYLPSKDSTVEPKPSEREQIGCWSSRHGNEPRPVRVKSIVDHLNLDISYTRAPTEARNNPSDGNDAFLVFSKLVRYIYPKRPLPPPNGVYTLMEKSPLGHELLPDEHLTCFDFLYYLTSSPETYEWKFSWSPPWLWVATHFHFTDKLVEIVEGYLGRVFGAPKDDLPPFIAVHMRRGDFAQQCWDTPGDCLIPPSTFEKKVASMRQELLETQNKHVKEVIIMSDETDPDFWEEIRELGWVHFDHTEEKTEQKYGQWYPPIIDIVAQSMAVGFIGTDDSTFSLVSARRVEDWHNGPTTMVSRADRDDR
ncbi:hypothetical protein GALMADRAFT_249034 [Galerina marginata CBS 339.88]|uniref:O-fucosyltransferase family protein n=1 Tax=Galerina marginata (strain CBS 339.88) TaxID=685588 RepID=A0A067SW47_GALM3|nr:hypothetical protein GALMADRAFT_249034 [Galerina marginata CBS 339.88]